MRNRDWVRLDAAFTVIRDNIERSRRYVDGKIIADALEAVDRIEAESRRLLADLPKYRRFE